MPWIKKGVIFQTNGEYWWSQTHTQIPTVDIIGDKFRIYYSSRDEKNSSHVSYFDVSAENPSEVLYVHQEEILPLGDIGTFDDCGVMPSSVIEYQGEKRFYYIGWNVRNTVPYTLAIGLATVSKDGVVEKNFKGPILDRGPLEPFLCATPFVIPPNNYDKWRMWYTSGTGYKKINGKEEPIYCIRYVESEDGVFWNNSNKIAIPYKNDHESITSSSVLVEDGIYKMWYTYRDTMDYRTDRAKSYSIGYAESRDGKEWVRMDDKVGINQSETGWDSEMMAYPCVVRYNNTKYMFYNGNGFGQSGIGYAIWEDEEQ